MTELITAATFGDEIANFPVCPSWRDECTANEPTKTPGVFYHGSPDTNIVEFKTRVEVAGTVTAGVFFTENPTYAACAAVRHANGMGGRIYCVELVTSNPFEPDMEMWIEGIMGDRTADRTICAELMADGYDSVIALKENGVFFEVIALDEAVIRRRDAHIKRLVDWHSRGKAVEVLTFWQVEDLRGPEYAPDCIPLFGKRKNANAMGAASSRVVVDGLNPVYCEERVWSRMHLGALRYADIDCLVDPATGNALVLNPDKIVPMNRVLLRNLRSQHRRGVRL